MDEVASPAPFGDWIGSSEHRTWATLYRTVTQLPVALHRHLQAEAGMGLLEYSVLFCLAQSDERGLRLSDLATEVQCELSRLSHLISRMERDGLVERRRDALDARATRAILTQRGADEFVRASPGHLAEIRRLVFAPLDDGEHEELERLLRKISNAPAPSVCSADAATP
ncbi:MarR family winged helix-turn-helix transcriptional regulator [Microbacterium sp.]|uniref:MarR family winged helix-turn-helix transcriptional regulator n=1 Tax=Microbacterium sp. TaxID=51671 RepID=UPI003242F097